MAWLAPRDTVVSTVSTPLCGAWSSSFMRAPFPPLSKRSAFSIREHSLTHTRGPIIPFLDYAGGEPDNATTLRAAEHVVVAKVREDERLHHLAEQHHHRP